MRNATNSTVSHHRQLRQNVRNFEWNKCVDSCFRHNWKTKRQLKWGSVDSVMRACVCVCVRLCKMLQKRWKMGGKVRDVSTYQHISHSSSIWRCKIVKSKMANAKHNRIHSVDLSKLAWWMRGWLQNLMQIWDLEHWRVGFLKNRND